MINKAIFKEVQAHKCQGYFNGAIVRAIVLASRTVAKYFSMREEDFRADGREQLFWDKTFDDQRSEILKV